MTSKRSGAFKLKSSLITSGTGLTPRVSMEDGDSGSWAPGIW